MRNAIATVIGVALLVLGAQGGIRLVVDHRNAGILTWLPGGFATQLICYVVIALAGVALARWGSVRSESAE